MTQPFLVDFIARHQHAVLSTVNENHQPEAALVAIAVTPGLKIIFDTVTTSRKYKNIIANPSIAFVIGWENEQTVQYEGTASILPHARGSALLETYFNAFPEGRLRKETWKDIVYFLVEPKWIRYSDFNAPLIEEMARFADHGLV